ncbi:hypothetical protein CAOG_06364 [Capsaspora owczarzaki ATCC 30864]|uniref:Exonuclease domain-containing protein n=1 Tax=Capsaspora owczarzaki (strain ATCC 30864) TaxID=595528 RepID=A0A0D2ULK1_CAPO3|nr:hypothetical protein CAOG_06364 [Capsaspora owczarzaki ATCC 30864]KJE95986.1 hypothetical protein CAOG_006364 [Capsaspora owczarzaki ATCC 30864]|eukprot:XP_004345113.1 hypothetical protein CAOG_06364 [Capsaspora owczarzaki ATCC 30864]
MSTSKGHKRSHSVATAPTDFGEVVDASEQKDANKRVLIEGIDGSSVAVAATTGKTNADDNDDDDDDANADDGAGAGAGAGAAGGKSGKQLRQERRNQRRLTAKAVQADDVVVSTINPLTGTPVKPITYNPLLLLSSPSALMDPQSTYTAVHGANAKPELELRLEQFFKQSGSSHLRLKDLQDLILWVVGDGINLRWVIVKNKPLIPRVVTVLLHNINPQMYAYYSDCFPFLSSKFQTAIPTRCPGSKVRIYSPVHNFLNIPLLKSKKKDDSNKASSAATNMESVYPKSHYFLTTEQMRNHGYPMPIDVRTPEEAGQFSEYKTLGKRDPNQTASAELPVFSLDCEMVKSEQGFELARLAIVSEKLEVLYDELIKPARPIVDYCTRYSGITPDMLENVTSTLKDAQDAVLRLIPSNAILVGHSLENDLNVLKIIHHQIVDTALAYSHTRGSNFKPSLRWLTETYLKRIIQADEGGHNPAEDASACMELLRLKLKNGPSFGINEEETESMALRLTRSGKKSTIIDIPTIARQHSIGDTNIVPCPSDDEILAAAIKAVDGPSSFVWSHFHGLEDFFSEAANQTDLDEQRLKAILTSYDQRAKLIYEACPANTLVVYFTGHGPIDELKRLQRQKDAAGAQWTATQEHELEEEVMKARDSLTFMGIKQ